MPGLDNVFGLERKLLDFAGQAESRLFDLISEHLAAEAAKPPVRAYRYLSFGTFTEAAKVFIAGVVRRLSGMALGILGRSRGIGAREATAALDSIRATAPRGPQPPFGVLVSPPDQLLGDIAKIAPRLLASATGIYRDVLTQMLADPAQLEYDRIRHAQVLLDSYAKRGITGFIDKSGRRWSMTAYLEMATRTAAANMAVEAHLQLCANNGYDIVKVTNSASPCPKCVPFQGRLLSISGRTRYRADVVATVAEAKAAGLLHPGCRHALQLWVPGDPIPDPPRIDPEAYTHSQQLRALERRLRKARTVHAAAMDPAAKRSAMTTIRDVQADIRAFTADTGQPRNRRRELIGHAL